MLAVWKDSRLPAYTGILQSGESAEPLVFGYGSCETWERSLMTAQFGPITSEDHPKLTAVVADTLRRKIILGELKQGDFIPPEPDLMVQLGVSRPTLREALRVLEAEALIRPRRGSRAGAEVCAPSVGMSARYMSFVLQYQGTTLDDVLKARQVVEPPLAGMVAASNSPAAFGALRAALQEEEDALGDMVAFGEASIRFHEKVAMVAGNDTLALCVRQFDWVLGRLTELVESGYSNGPAGNVKAHRAHKRFIAIVETGDAVETEKFWRSHVDAIARVLLSGRRGEKIANLF